MTDVKNNAFIQALERSNLLSIEQTHAARQWAGGADGPLTIAKLLIRRGWITRWQAQQLLAGRTKLYLGKYKLLEGLGRGGMGSVFKAEQPSLKRVVALKVMSRELLQRPGALNRFQREMRAAGALNHPNIVVAHDADSVGDTHFLVMECISGYNLKDWIRHYEQLPIDWSCDVVRQTSLGLQHAHEQGMVHRDIKPSNLIISTEESSGLPLVKILDMGLARFASTQHESTGTNWDGLENLSTEDGAITMTGQIIGSPNYIAPEQAENPMQADIRADIYGLGTTFFEMLTGQLPFNGSNILEVLKAKLTYDAPRVSELRNDIPSDLDDIVDQMLSRDPANRFQTPGEVADAMAPYTDYLPDQESGKPSTAQEKMSDASIVSPAMQSIGTSVEARADDTVDEFLDQLADRVVITTEKQSMATIGRKPRKDNLAWVFNLMIAGVVLSFGIGIYALWDSDSEPNNAGYKSPTTGKSKTVVPDAPPDDHRRAAEWVLVNDGRVTIELNREQRIVSETHDLPDEAFVLVKVQLESITGIQMARLGVLNGIGRLESLSLSRCDVTDNDVDGFKSMPSLTDLDLSYTQITSAAFEKLAGVTSLKRLNVSRTVVGDASFELLTGLDRLTILDLEQTDVSDASVEHLKKMSRLQMLNIDRTKITSKGAESIRKSLPRCDVEFRD